jgi:hypothetical protein
MEKSKKNNTSDADTAFDHAFAEKVGAENVHFLNPKLSLIKRNNKASLKSKIIMALAIVGVWIPFIPSIIALSLVPSARREAEGNPSTLALTKWGKIVSLVFLIINIVGLLALAILVPLTQNVFIEACKTLDEVYCQFVLP